MCFIPSLLIQISFYFCIYAGPLESQFASYVQLSKVRNGMMLREDSNKGKWCSVAFLPILHSTTEWRGDV